ncbi:MAG: tetratricopeptide repeat protein [Pseudomonadota bacterium]
MLLFPRLPAFARAAAVVAALCCTAIAHADDEYAQVQQLMRSGKLAEALAKTQQAIAARPKDPQMRFLQGVIHTEAGRPGEAIATFTALTQDYPELAEPYNNLAVLYAGQGQYDKARAALEQALRVNPNYGVAYENLGDVYARLAAQSYERAGRLEPKSPSVPAKLTLVRQLFTPRS